MRASLLAAVAATFAAAPAVGQEAEPSASPAGVYRGVYVCNQGLTGATVRFCEAGGRLEIGFRFYAVDPNPDVPGGVCYLAGAYDEAARAIRAEPAGWGSRPGPQWIIAPFSGVFDAEYENFRGFVTAPGCGFITLQRVADDVDGAPECGPGIG